MGVGFGELMVILVVVLILFGAGKLPNVMSEMGKGVKNFKDGMKDDDTAPAQTAATPTTVPTPLITSSVVQPAQSSVETSKDHSTL